MINVGYAMGQLARALSTAGSHADAGTRERAAKLVQAWTQAIEGMASGSIRVGSRTPVDAPAWATLEVLHGGFASGNLLAGGEPAEHETALASRLGVSADDRLALNLHYCTDAGREELRQMLRAGTYRIGVPEEGALPAVVALADAGRAEAASAILDAIAAWMPRLRFFPAPASTPLLAGHLVHVESVGTVRDKLEDLETPEQVLRMNETLGVWRPFADRVGALLLTTVEGEAPLVVTDATGAGRRGPNGELIVSGGRPGRAIPDGFRTSARALLDEYAALHRVHGRCRRIHGCKSSLGRMTGRLEQMATTGRPLEPRESGMLRVVLATHAFRHGSPGSAKLAERRAADAAHAARPTRATWGALLASRLVPLSGNQGLVNIEPYAGAIDAAEAAKHGVAAAAAPPRSMLRRLERALDATIDELIERGLIPSGEVLARVLPQVSSHVRAEAIPDRRAALLRATIDAAFTRRRSLLLLDYAKQVRIGELPWVAALDTLRASDRAAGAASRRLLENVTLLSMQAFPHAILPNPLISELRSLAKAAGVEIPFTEELAADIFRGGFTPKFVRAAVDAADLLESTLYARFYDVPFAEMRALATRLGPPPKPGGFQRARPIVVDEMGAACRRMAGVSERAGFSVALNGAVIEQQQILTTQNLAPLIVRLDVRHEIADVAAGLADRCFDWIVEELSRPPASFHDGLHSSKNAAYAWRQMLVFLSLAPAGAAGDFDRRARASLAEARPSVERRLTPFLDGVRWAAQGRVTPPGQRFLGWVTA